MLTYIEKYLLYLKKIRNYSDNTISSYNVELIKYKDYLDKLNIDYRKVTKENIWDYLKDLDGLYKNSSINHHLSTLRSFYEYLKEEEVINTNIFLLIRNPKKKKSLPNVLNYDEINKLLDFKELDNINDYRDRLIFEMLYSTGLRVSELSNIKLKDIDMKEKSIKVLGKGNKERYVYYSNHASHALKEYLDIRNTKSEYLFINSKDERLSRQSIEDIVNKRIKKISLMHHISPHTLRHTFATDMLKNGADIRVVQELLGHKKLSTTEIYTHLSNEYLRSEYLKNMQRR